MTSKYYSVSAPKASQDASLEFMVHHLQLAHMYFQNTVEDSPEKREEVKRLFQEQYHMTVWHDDGGFGRSEDTVYFENAPENVCGMLWLEKMEEIYNNMED